MCFKCKLYFEEKIFPIQGFSYPNHRKIFSFRERGLECSFRVLLVLLVGIFLVCVVDFFSLATMKIFAPQGKLARVLWSILYVIHDIVTPSYTFAFMLLGK
uniref:7TM GPCR serpentine receptor class x (Srx) domain-containing protein n=1 Tax=Ascaris lumbricoides TaxID=6252 RepID=A0A9J2PPN4_ASCLU